MGSNISQTKADQNTSADDKLEEIVNVTEQQDAAALVRILWVDTSGQSRCRVVPVKRFHNVIRDNGIGLSAACMALTSLRDCTTGLPGTGEIRLFPDLSSLRTIPWTKGEEMVLADMHLRPGKPWECCPRQALKRAAKALKQEFNLELDAGFEVEFYLLTHVTREGKEEWLPFDSTPYCSTLAFDAAAPILRDMLGALQSLNIPVEQVHSEAGKGQFEVALGHNVCLKAADDLVFTREVIRAVARKHGFVATLAPKYVQDDFGSGSHVHLSLLEDGVNVFTGSLGSEHGISKVGKEFMAGVLHHLPAILAFTATNPNSYDRIQPNIRSGAYQCWGKENREASLRTACPPGIKDGLVSNFEFKSFDGCTNPYLGLASIIAAGIDGLRKHLSLPPPIETNPSNMEDEVRRLPASLSESLEALQMDNNIFEEFLGEKLLTTMKGVRKAEIEIYSESSEAYKELIYRY